MVLLKIMQLSCKNDLFTFLGNIVKFANFFFKKNGPFPASFFFIFVFSIQLTVNKCSINFADDWIRTADLWYRKRPLYQLSHTTTAQNMCLCLKQSSLFSFYALPSGGKLKDAVVHWFTHGNCFF